MCNARSMFLTLAIVTGLACGGGSGDGGTTPAASEPAAAAEPAASAEAAPAASPSRAEQVAAGQAVWDERCRNCHKYGSEGGELVGPFARSKAKNAAELVAFIKEKMPKDDPGTLSDEQAWAVTAAILDKRGALGDAALTAENAAALSLE